MISYEDWNKLLTYRDEIRNRTLWNSGSKKYVIDFGCKVNTIYVSGTGYLPNFELWLKDKDGEKFGFSYNFAWEYDTLRDDYGESIFTHIEERIDEMCNRFILGQGESW